MFENPLGLMQEVWNKSGRRYKHKVLSVIENDIVKIPWDVYIQVDRSM